MKAKEAYRLISKIKHSRKETAYPAADAAIPLSLLAVIVRLFKSSRALVALFLTFVYG